MCGIQRESKINIKIISILYVIICRVKVRKGIKIVLVPKRSVYLIIKQSMRMRPGVAQGHKCVTVNTTDCAFDPH